MTNWDHSRLKAHLTFALDCLQRHVVEEELPGPGSVDATKLLYAVEKAQRDLNTATKILKAELLRQRHHKPNSGETT